MPKARTKGRTREGLLLIIQYYSDSLPRETGLLPKMPSPVAGVVACCAVGFGPRG